MTVRIVVEGPDGAGKSNLVQAIVRDTGLRVMDRASATEGPIPELAAYVDEDLLSHIPKSGGIYDRYPLISEPIYGPVVRGYMQFSAKDHIDFQWISQRMELFYHYQPLIIYCLPPFYEVEKNVSSSEQMEGVHPNLRTIYDLYAAQYCRDSHRARVHHWDYTAGYNYDNILRDVTLLKDWSGI